MLLSESVGDVTVLKLPNLLSLARAFFPVSLLHPLETHFHILVENDGKDSNHNFICSPVLLTSQFQFRTDPEFVLLGS